MISEARLEYFWRWFPWPPGKDKHLEELTVVPNFLFLTLCDNSFLEDLPFSKEFCPEKALLHFLWETYSPARPSLQTKNLS